MTGVVPSSRVHTAAEVAEEWLREEILAGRLKPGARIDQDAAAKELGMSRIPIREALTKLSHSGLVTVRPRRGARVAPISIDHIEEVYMMRASLESLAARLAAQHMTNEVISRLEEILAEIREAIDTHDAERLFNLNRDFHTTGYSASGKAFLNSHINNLRDHCDRYRHLQVRMRDRTIESLEEHRQILDAWASRDAVTAERCTRINLTNSGAALTSQLRKGLPMPD